MATLKNTSIDLTGLLTLPAGTTEQRPSVPVTGMIRSNTTFRNVEYYNGSRWIDAESGIDSGIVSSGLVWYLDMANPLCATGSGNTLRDLSKSNLHAHGSSLVTGGSLIDTQPYRTGWTPLLNTDNHTILMMVQFNGVNGAWSKVFGYTPPGTDRSPGVWRFPSSRLIHWQYDPGNIGFNFGRDSAGNEFLTNTWYYLGVSKVGGTATVYVNGTSIVSGSVPNPKTSGIARIELYPEFNQNTSKMSMIHIYDRPLTGTDILQNFNVVRTAYGI